PEQARTALTTIKQASKDVLTEMRGVLSLLRDAAPKGSKVAENALKAIDAMRRGVVAYSSVN
ncbi:hypothetical protein, partial [Microbispora rosea]